MSSDVEKCYVYDVYNKIASHLSQSSFDNAPQRSWPNVSKFIGSLDPGSIIVDVGCGPNKYATKNCFMIGVDNCSEVLIKSKNSGNSDRDVIIGDALNLPFRKDFAFADAILSVSVLHHFSTLKRRKRAVEQICNIMSPFGGIVMFYVWAKEQPYGEFGSQDVLVPWNMHEIPLTVHFPYIRFHKNSTREQRIIANSIPIEVDNGQSNRFIGSLVKFVSNKLLRIERQLPPAIPQFINDKKHEGLKQMVVSGIHRWSPMLSKSCLFILIIVGLGRRLKLIQVDVTELYASELAHKIFEEAVAEALSTLRKVIFYRYYHVFKRGELEELVVGTPGLKVLSVVYDSANWCCFAQKSVVTNLL